MLVCSTQHVLELECKTSHADTACCALTVSARFLEVLQRKHLAAAHAAQDVHDAAGSCFDALAVDAHLHSACQAPCDWLGRADGA